MILPLYQGLPPNSTEIKGGEIQEQSDQILKISNIQQPTIEVCLPPADLATGEAVIICPGGGYWILAYDIEGTDIAEALNKKGVAAIILKYRLPTSHQSKIRHQSSLLDAQRAIRMVRQHASAWHINPQKVGIMGFSAGGHLASTVATQFDEGNPEAIKLVDRYSSRPDFSLLIYPVISFHDQYTHQGSRKALLGENENDESLQLKFSAERNVTTNTPPAFLVHSTDDTGVPCENSINYFNACRKNNVDAELHLFPVGGHGFGLGKAYPGLDSWTDLAIEFIHRITSTAPQ